jgi:hypothetical protein
MTDEQLIEKIAEILFKEEEIDAWSIYDNLEGLFVRERPAIQCPNFNVDIEMAGK